MTHTGFVVTVVFRSKPGCENDFRKAVEQQAINSLEKEPHCRRFDVCYDPSDAQIVFLYELYRDREAFDDHVKTAHFLSFSERVQPWVESKEVRTLDLIAPERSEA